MSVLYMGGIGIFPFLPSNSSSMAFFRFSPLFFFLAFTCTIALFVSPSSSSSILEYSPEDLLSESRLLELFHRWNSLHGKDYTGLKLGRGQEEEKRRRYDIFKQNLRYIHEHNMQKGKAYKLGLTRFADMTNEEFRESMFLGLRLNNTSSVSRSNAWHEYGKQAEKICFEDNKKKKMDILSSLDWRKLGFVTPIKDQGACGSSWAFATIAAVESVNAITTGDLIGLSEQELVGCDHSNYGCHGGDMNLAMEWIIKNGGVGTATDYPYSSMDGEARSCQLNAAWNKAVSIDNYANVSPYDEDALLCVATQQPVIVGINGGAYDFQLYAGGIFDGDCPGEPEDLNHAVVIEGYGSTSSSSSEEEAAAAATDGMAMDYWIVRNSWGENWGSNGYVYIARKTDSHYGVCGINSQPSYPIKLSATPTDNENVVAQAPVPSPTPGGEPPPLPVPPPPPPPSPPPPPPYTQCDLFSACGPHQTCCCTFSFLDFCLLWSCCDYESAVCCDGGKACCPSEFPICDLKHGFCLQEHGTAAVAERMPLQKRTRAKFHNPLGFNDLLMPLA